jgi:hypothetical protein
MNRHRITCVLTVLFAAVATAAAGQQPGSPGLAIDGRRAIDQTLEFIKIEAAMGRVVQGAPYSGEGLTTVVQTLADGTRIERTVRARLYRDTEGRTRREQTILGLGALGESRSVTIVDPVARVTYVLNPATHQGWRSPMPTLRHEAKAPLPAGGGDVGALVPPPPPPPPGGGMRGGAPGFAPNARGSASASRLPERVPNLPEQLGTRQIEGVMATGTKRTEVIPTGRIGNDRPIEITDERWESSELQVLMLSRHHDPRTGDVEYRLTNVVRSDPPREMFEPPADYTITDAPPPPPPAPRRPEY